MPERDELLSAKDLISRHEQWKLTLWAAAFSRKPLTLEQLEQIVHPARCPIGRWLDSDQRGDIRQSEEFAEVLENHLAFHQEMMEVAALLTAKQFPEAVRAIRDGSSFAETGRRLARSILALNRVQRILATP